MVGTSIDHFIDKGHKKNILFMPKWSRLVRKCPVRFSNGKNKMAAKLADILFLPFENRTNSTSLDRYIKKRVMNKIFFMPKRSRLASGTNIVGLDI